MRPDAKPHGPRKPMVDRFSPYLLDEVTFSRGELLAARANPLPAAPPAPSAPARRRNGTAATAATAA